MKTFSVSKNSWHYRFNVRIAKQNPLLSDRDYADVYVSSKDNICAYWRLTVYNFLKVVAAAGFMLIFVGLLGFVAYVIVSSFIAMPMQALATAALLTVFLGTVALFVVIGNAVQTRRENKLNLILHRGETDTSLARAKYTSWRDGICVPVEFKND